MAQSTDFPVSQIDRLARRRDAVIQHHRAGVSYVREHERLLRIAIMEKSAVPEDLNRTAQNGADNFGLLKFANH